MRTSESSRLLNQALFLCFETIFVLVESWSIMLNFSTFSVRGCWGQSMLLFWKMVVVPKWPILIPFCGLDHQKSKFLLVSCNLDVRGCWGQPILLFWKNIDKTQMSPSSECAATFFWTWKSTLVGHPGLQSMSYRVGTPCKIT